MSYTDRDAPDPQSRRERTLDLIHQCQQLVATSRGPQRQARVEARDPARALPMCGCADHGFCGSMSAAHRPAQAAEGES